MDEYRGHAASTGIAIGPACAYVPDVIPDDESTEPVDAGRELERLTEAVEEARSQLASIHAKSLAEVGEETAGVFVAHREFLDDPELLRMVKEQICSDGVLASAAVDAAFETYARMLEAMDDEYYRDRALDLRDVSRRVRRILAGVQDQETLAHLASPVVVVARDLTPSDTAQMNKSMVLGFCTAKGGPTSHTAIISRILGIPAVVGIGEEIMQVQAGASLIVDGGEGLVLAGCDDAITQEYAKRRDTQIQKQATAKKAAQAVASTRDSHKVEIVANIADATSAKEALSFGAEGVGLFRTEYLFLNRQRMPSEEEQYQDYRAVADVLGPRPLVVRTLDIGGDKQLPYLDMGEEMNPFLGWRAVRLCLDSPELFETQLRAILRASVDRNVQIMFPMIATLGELRRARGVLEQVQNRLTHEGVAFDRGMQVGIMIEVPSAAVMADVLAPAVDFFSIGTNDLIQYTMACDRGNEKVAYLYDPLHPAVLRLIKGVIKAAHAHEKWVGMCGEMAGDLEAIPLLLGLGLDEFSMNAPAIPAAKELIRSLTLRQAQEIAEKTLTMSTAGDVRGYLRGLGLAQS